MRSIRSIHELRRDPDARSGPPHAAADRQRARRVRALRGEDAEVREAREVVDDLLAQPDGAYATLYQLQLLEGRKAERRMVPS